VFSAMAVLALLMAPLLPEVLYFAPMRRLVSTQAPSGLSPVPGLSASQALVSTSASDGDLFVPVVPFRIVDTRSGSGCGAISPPGTLRAGSTALVQVTGTPGCEGTSGEVPSGASAVALDVTVVEPTSSGYLTIWSAGTSRPVVSNLDFVSGQLAVSNMAMVALSSSGSLDVFNSAGLTNLVIDVEGYFISAGVASGDNLSGELYHPMVPVRVCDTRVGNPSGLSGKAAQCNGHELSPGVPLQVQVAGVSGIPSNALAVVVSLAVVDPSGSGFETAYPASSQAPPSISDINFSSQETLANEAIVELSASGAIDLLADVSTNALVDVYGYFTSGSSGSAFYPELPYRIVDTRAGSGCGNMTPDAPLSPGGISKVTVGTAVGCEGTSAVVAPSGATAVAANLTLVRQSGQDVGDYLTPFPSLPVPVASSLNVSSANPDTAIAAESVIGLSSSGDFYLFNHSGDPNVVIDVFGFFGPGEPSVSTNDVVPQQVESENWSGYALTGGPFSSVTGTFSVTQMVQGDAPPEDLSEWVGIGGFNSDGLIQAGIDETPDPYNPGEYFIIPWWEVLPAAQTDITSMEVAPGNEVSVTISQLSPELWSIKLTDDTTGQSFVTDQDWQGGATSVEWILEAPMADGSQTPLAAYSPPASFSALGVSGNPTDWYQIFMFQGGVQVSTPSSLGEDGFEVAYGS